MDPQGSSSSLQADSLPPITNEPTVATPPEVTQTQSAAGPAQAQQAAALEGLQFASYISRFIAAVMDGVLLGVIGFIFQMIFIFGAAAFAKANPALAMVAPLLNFIISLLIAFFYYVIFQHNNGQTVGKKMLGIKVVDLTTGQTPSMGKLFMREFIGKMLSVMLLIGYFMPLWDAKKQALHDKIAGTVVVVKV